MEGRARAAKREAEQRLIQAYNGEAFAREKRLKPASHYLASLKPRGQRMHPAEQLTVFQELKDRGAPLTIRKVN